MPQTMNVAGELNIKINGTSGIFLLTSAGLTLSALDGTPIGGTTAAAGTFTTITSTGEATLDSLVVNGTGRVGGATSGSPKFGVRRTSGTTAPLLEVEAAIGSFTGTSVLAGNTLSASATFNLYEGVSDSDGDAGGPHTVFKVNGLGAVGVTSHLATPAGGTAGYGLLFGTTANFGIFFGSGAPTLAAAQGSIYLRSDGSSTSTRLYVNTDGSTTWTNVTTAA